MHSITRDNIFISLVLLAVSGLSGFLYYNINQPISSQEHQATSTTADITADIVIHNATVTSPAPKIHISHINAQQVSIYRKENMLNFYGTKCMLSNKMGFISSPHAQLKKKENKLLLHNAKGCINDVQFNGKTIIYNLETGFIVSPQAIELTTNNITMTGNQANINTKKETLNIHGGVKTIISIPSDTLPKP